MWVLSLERHPAWYTTDKKFAEEVRMGTYGRGENNEQRPWNPFEWFVCKELRVEEVVE